MSKKWNILVIVIFVMLLCSLSALLISNYMKSLITYSSEFNKYYKAYYMANSWIEISLTKISNHDFGFEDTINSWSNTIKQNFECWDKCFFETKITTRSNYIFDWDNDFIWQDCTDWESFELWTWQWLIIPLFWDSNWNNENVLSWTNTNLNYFPNTELDQVEIKRDWSWLYSYGIFYFNNWEMETLVKTGNASLQALGCFTTIPELWKKYIVIVNIDPGQKQNFCIESVNQKITGTKTLVQSDGIYLDRIVHLETLKINKLHDFIIYSINNYYN
jgi:hypothetical protein